MSTRRSEIQRVIGLVAPAAVLGIQAIASDQPCQPHWTDRFPYITFAGGTPRCAAVYDDGSGPAIFVGGGTVLSKWSNGMWSTVASVNGIIHAMGVYDDDGPGPHRPMLYVTGEFTAAGGVSVPGTARWDGSVWSAVGSGFGYAFPFCVFNDGSGTALYAHGYETGASRPRMAKWDGNAWTFLGPQIGPGNEQWDFPLVAAISPFDDGSGTSLYIAGGLTDVGGAPVSHIAKWTGSQWVGLPGAIQGTGRTEIYCLLPFDDGSGPALYAGGGFESAGGLPAANVARWNGSAWSAVGSGLTMPPPTGATVYALAAFNDGSAAGPVLYAAGVFAADPQSPLGYPVGQVARWDGTAWHAAEQGRAQGRTIYDLLPWTSNGRPALYAFGMIGYMDNVDVGGVARLQGTAWSRLGVGFNQQVNALTVFGGSRGSAASLYVAGNFGTAGDTTAAGIARWDGAGWSSFPELHGVGESMAVHDDGGGAALYVAGSFWYIGGAPVSIRGVLRWDGRTWSALENPAHPIGTRTLLAVHDDGGGPALFSAGPTPDGGPTRDVTRWDGSDWQSIGTFPQQINAMASFDDGSGPALYIGGGGPYISRWKNGAWSSFGGGVDDAVWALQAYTGPTGPALYAGGFFRNAGGVSAPGLARWDGHAWSAVSGVGGGLGAGSAVSGLGVADDGSGPALYIGGAISTAAGQPAHNIARWDGTAFSTLGSGVGGAVYAFQGYDDGTGPSVFIGGDFTGAGGQNAAYFAQWLGCVPGSCYANCDGSTVQPVLNVQDFVCFLQLFAAHDPHANCDGSTLSPTLNVNDFLCFMRKFAQGCP